ncbi:MAG: HD domain-containing protein [Lachnospiraceae bacterium]|nr:HD domain-containing protein [Lachnospiraceae bacterium]
MEKWKNWQIALFVALCVCINVGGKQLAVWLELPLWADSFGTVLCAYIAGPICGAIVGMTANLSYSVVNSLSVAYSLTSIALGIIIGIAAKKKWFDRFYGFMMATTLAMFTALVVSVPLDLIFDNGYTGNKWGNGVVDYLLVKKWPAFLACIMGQLAIEFADKVLTVAAVYIIILIRHSNSRRKDDNALQHGGTGAVMLLCVVLGMGLLPSVNVYARDAVSQTETPDYNDYVQNVYNNNNGLPCGEANDIVQTNDGVLWIGTYAGLYRYNGRELRLVEDYESVKNVNCLYVDEEGRLWIGTSDNGLSIVINENFVNDFDESDGLPSSSVKCIIHSSDGYYYIGTTGSMQILVMNNGLKAVKTLDEVYYSDSISADGYCNVAAITDEGRLFLINHGDITCELKLRDDNELFNCCAFAPDGTLMVGSSTDHIYRYSIFEGTLKQIDAITCDGAAGINSLNYLDDGTLFICADNGVAYMNGNVCRWLNTNDFSNSIDNMLYDYQGNLWFTSSRLGLLRLTKSPFKDIYGTIGMERKLVNAVVLWQDCYYIGTDEGLDVVDKTCRKQINADTAAEELDNPAAARLAKTVIGDLEKTRIRCMLVDSSDHLWICTYGSGVTEYAPDGKKWIYTADNGSFGNKTRAVIELTDGTILAAGNTGISYIKNHRVEKSILKEDGLENPKILSLLERNDKTILAGTDGDGIAVIKEGRVTEILSRDEGLSSDVILRMIQDPKSDGVFIVTGNGLCYLGSDGSVKALSKFPYYNNYDIWVKDEDTFFVMSSAGIYVGERDELVSGGEGAWELLDAKRGLGTSLTPNSWNYYNGNGELYLPCDTGVYVIDVDKYNSDVRSYRMKLAYVRMDGVQQSIPRRGPITMGQGVDRIEFGPEILNYTIQEPNVGYMLEGYDTRWTIKSQKSLDSIIYNNLPAGRYTFRMAVFDSAGTTVLETHSVELEKVGEIYEQPGFRVYMLLILSMIMIWFTWLVVQRQLNQQQIKLNMANETVMAIANAVDAKDVRTHQHSVRVAEYSALIAREMNCFKWWERNKEIANLKKAAQLHDIGKIGVPDAVLNKVGRLTDEEYVQMKSHVDRGAEILKDFTLVEHVEEGTRYHHERYDGRGYPKGLKGEEIPLIGRIISVADAFDAMTSNRVYRNHMDTDYVLNEMKRGRGTQFDPDVLDAFLRLIDKGVINLEELYAQKRAEIMQADQEAQEELKRRVEEDKKIQAANMQNKGGEEKPETKEEYV